MLLFSIMPDRHVNVYNATVLTCALFAVVCGACAHKTKKAPDPSKDFSGLVHEVRESVRAEVTDPDRATQMLAELDRAEELFGQLQTIAKKFSSDFAALDRNYDATDEQFQSLFEKYEHDRDPIRSELLDLQIRFKQLATADEWSKVSKIDEDLLKERIDRIE